MTAEARRRGLAVALGGLLATAAFFHRALLGDVFLARDMLLVYLPLRRYWAERLLSGSFPDWYPYDGLGQPFAGMVISAVFHPVNVLYLLLPAPAALSVNVLLCFPVALGGVYALVRRFALGTSAAVLGGVVFAFCGYLVSSTNNLLYLMAAATVPWALWGADRYLARPSWGRATLAGWLSALVLLAGDVQAFALTLGLLAVLAFCRRARLPAAAALLASALAASLVQLVPAFEASTQARRGQQSLAQATLWSTHPLRLWDVLLGPVFGRPPDDAAGRLLARRLLDAGQATLWVDSLYLGLPAAVLALAGAWAYRRSRTGRAVALCTGLLLLLALGKRGGLSQLAFHLVPFWRAFRYPEKWMALVSLGVALGGAAGAEAVLQRARLRSWAGRLLGVLGLLALLAAAEEARWGALGGWMAGQLGTSEGKEAAHLALELARGAAVSGGLAVLCAAVLLWAQRTRLVAWALPVVCFLGLLFFNEPIYQLASPEVVEHPSPFLADVRGTPWRVLHLTGAHVAPTDAGLTAVDRHALGAVAGLEPVTPALFGVEDANTYLPAGSARVFELSDNERAWVLERAGLFSTRYLSIAEGNAASVAASGKRVLETLPRFGYVFLEDASALPRAYLARPLCVPGPAESLEAVQARRFVPGVEAVVECTRPLSPGTGAPGQVLSLASAPERVVLKVQATDASVLVLNDAFYAGWRATVDGADVPILAANHAVRAVFVEKGVHDVIFSYRTPGLWVGLCLSLGFLLGGALSSIRAGRKGKGIPARAADGQGT